MMNKRSGFRPMWVSLSLMLGMCGSSFAVFTEAEPNNTKSTANGFDLGTNAIDNFLGSSANSADVDYARLTTHYADAFIRVNRVQEQNFPGFAHAIRGRSQSAGVINVDSDIPFQTSLTGTPAGLNVYYALPGVGKTQSVNVSTMSVSSTASPNYNEVINATSAGVPSSIGNFTAGRIAFNAVTNTTTGSISDSSIVILDSNYNVYHDSVASSSTLGYVATNDNGAGGFTLNRAFPVGIYYIAIGLGTVATDQAAAPDDANQSYNVLDYPNVLATNSPLTSSVGNVYRPIDFTVSDSAGRLYAKANDVITTPFGVNFYSFTVMPEPTTLCATIGFTLAVLRRPRR